MEYLSGIPSELPPREIRNLFHYRFNVFIEHLQWDVVAGYGSLDLKIERDQFDTDETIYVVAKNSQQSIVGCARLLPTTKPYLLRDVFPELLNGMAAPDSSDVWELSRFTSFDLDNVPATTGQFSAESTVALLHKTMLVAQSYGAKKLVSVSPIAVERLLRRESFASMRLGPPIRSCGQLLIACLIDIEQSLYNQNQKEAS